MSPPGAAALNQEARGGGSRGSQKARENPAYVQVVNASWNGWPVMRRKDAEHYEATGRAVWLRNEHDGQDQIRLVDSKANDSARSVAALAYERAVTVMIRKPEELRHVPVLCPRIALTKRSRVTKQDNQTL